MVQDEELTSFGIQVGQDVARMFKLMIKMRQKAGLLRECDAGMLSEIITVCLSYSTLIAASQIIICSPESLSRNLSGLITPVLFPDRQLPKLGRSKISSLDNDKKIRRDLLKAAKEEFIAHGYFEAKIAHITNESGYSRRTFYHYFKNKDELLNALFLDMMGSFYLQPQAQDNFIEALNIRSIGDLVRPLTEIIQVLDVPMARAILQGFFNSPGLIKLHKDMYALYGDPLAKKISSLQEMGLCSSVDPKIAAYIIVATISFTAFLCNIGFVSGNVHKCALNLGWFLVYFANYRKPVD
jgi:AcrR family transcriptional regulator